MNETKLKIIVVDDMPIVREFVVKYFQRRNYTIFAAESAEDALPIIIEQKPDIMLLDIDLPKMSGIELLRLVRNFNTTVKVIMVSGYTLDLQNDKQLKALNIFEVLNKPVELPELGLAINRAAAELNK